MLTHFSSNEIALPRDWTANVRTAVLHVISLARLAITCTRSFAANSLNARIRLASELERAKEEISRLEEELRIKDRLRSCRYAGSGKTWLCKRIVADTKFDDDFLHDLSKHEDLLHALRAGKHCVVMARCASPT